MRDAYWGYAYLHTAIDDRSRLAFTEVLGDEKSVTAAGFWVRAVAFFAAHVIGRIAAVLTDNGSCYRDCTFNRALGDAVKHRSTGPYRPETNRKVERYQRTLAREWAYQARLVLQRGMSRRATGFLHRYNYYRPRTG